MLGVWTMDISTAVFSRIVNDFSPKIKENLKMKEGVVNGARTWLNFSTSQVSQSKDLIFPYITVIELPGAERAQSLEGSTINGALFTFQVDVIDNQSENRAKICMKEIIRIMKEMRFSMPTIAAFESKPQEYRMTARFSRLICSDDRL